MSCFYNKKGFMIHLHSIFNNSLLHTKTSISVIDSHGAYPYYDKSCDTIILDTHFFDILRIITAAILTNDTSCMDSLVDLCVADYFVCKDEIYLALEHAKMFNRKKDAVIKTLKKAEKSANDLFFRQLLFVLFHEQGHGLLNYNSADVRFAPYRYHFEKELKTINSITCDILSINLLPIKDKLDRLDRSPFVGVYTYSEKDTNILLRSSMELLKIAIEGTELLEIPESIQIPRLDAVLYACGCYLNGGDILLLKKQKYEDDCIIDGYTIQRLITAEKEGESIISRMRETVFSYYSCLLTMNIITCVNACVMNYQSEGYREEDLVWNRLRLEREIYNNVMCQYAFRYPFGVQIANDIFEYSQELIDSYNIMYARFCDKIYAVDLPNESIPYCSCSNSKYRSIYDEVAKNLLLTL